MTLIACTIALGAGASSANAGVTIGSDLTGAATASGSCSAQPLCTYVQTVLPGRTLAAPITGVVVRWRIKTSGAGGPFSLRVMRPAGGGALTAISTSIPQITAGPPISEYNTRLPIQAGDLLGLGQTDVPGAGNYFAFSVPGASNYYKSPAVADGVTAGPSNTNTNFEMLVNADIEADADGDGYGDETQDLCPSQAGTAGACVAVIDPPPVVKLSAAKKQRVTKLAIKVTVNEAATVSAKATATSKSKPGKKYGGRTTRAIATAGVPTTLKLKFSKSRLKSIRKLLEAGKSVKVAIAVSTVDTGGSPVKANKTVTLKPAS